VPAAASSAAAGEAAATSTATMIGPITQIISTSAASAASAGVRRWAWLLSALVSAFHAPRTAAVIGGKVSPARAAADHTRGRLLVIRVARTSPASASGWATPVKRSTGVAPMRSAVRPSAGLAAALASA
jgi:hypothetical protein